MKTGLPETQPPYPVNIGKGGPDMNARAGFPHVRTHLAAKMSPQMSAGDEIATGIAKELTPVGVAEKISQGVDKVREFLGGSQPRKLGTSVVYKKEQEAKRQGKR